MVFLFALEEKKLKNIHITFKLRSSQWVQWFNCKWMLSMLMSMSWSPPQPWPLLVDICSTRFQSSCLSCTRPFLLNLVRMPINILVSYEREKTLGLIWKQKKKKRKLTNGFTTSHISLLYPPPRRDNKKKKRMPVNNKPPWSGRDGWSRLPSAYIHLVCNNGAAIGQTFFNCGILKAWKLCLAEEIELLTGPDPKNILQSTHFNQLYPVGSRQRRHVIPVEK